ncbi:MAG TPA: hypothetical protein VGI47_02480 [Candidatus Binataceae bacterium]|jgi:hypothetical protein
MDEHELLNYAFEQSDTLFRLLAGQRTRRVFKGFSKDISGEEIHGASGNRLSFHDPGRFEPGSTPLTWEGNNLSAPEPLSELEEAILLWAACGPNGIVAGDIGLNENLSTMVCMAGRTIPGPCNDAAVNMVVVNDRGTWLYRPTYDREKVVEIEGPEDYSKVLKWYREGMIKLSDQRLDCDWSLLPGRPWGIYQFNSNKPGSTMFIPVFGMAHEMVNYLFAAFEFLGWNIIDEATGQSAGLKPWVKKHRLDYDLTQRYWETFFFATECNPPAMAIQNIRLAAESLGLGSWNHSTNTDVVLGGFQDKAKGLNMVSTDFNGAKNFVGLKGVLEGCGLPAPWNASPEEVVDHVLEGKYGSGVFMGKGSEFLAIEKGPFKPAVRDAVRAHKKSKVASWCVEAAKAYMRYTFDHYGRYPVYLSDFQTSAFMIEVSHCDIRYYENFNVPGYINSRIRRHHELWHSKAGAIKRAA